MKDNIDVAGQPTTAACPDFEYVPAQHAAAVAPLLEAGARAGGAAAAAGEARDGAASPARPAAAACCRCLW